MLRELWQGPRHLAFADLEQCCHLMSGIISVFAKDMSHRRRLPAPPPQESWKQEITTKREYVVVLRYSVKPWSADIVKSMYSMLLSVVMSRVNGNSSYSYKHTVKV